jgi:hypothetical protein
MGLDNEPSLYRQFKNSRRQVLRNALFTTGAAVLGVLDGCAPATAPTVSKAPPTIKTEGYPLTQMTINGQRRLVDQQFETTRNPVSMLRFNYDINYQPTNTGNGAIALEISRLTDGPIRLMSEELKPRPRFLFNDTCPYVVKAGEILRRWPVYDLTKEDVQRIYL